MSELPGRRPCSAIVPLLSAYLDDELTYDETDDVATHLRDCAGCAEYVAQLAGTVRALRTLRTLPPAHALPALSPQAQAELARAYLCRPHATG